MTSGKVATTIGYERRNNPALRFNDEERFVTFMVHDQPPRPANMRRIVAINQGHLPVPGDPQASRSLSAAEAQALFDAGRVALDTREPQAFGGGHPPGALNAWVEADSFEQAVGWIVPGEDEFILVAEDAEEARRAIDKLAFVGLDRRVAGWVGIADWRASKRPEERLPSIDVRTARDRIENAGVQVLDVRGADEWREAHISGAVNVDYRHLPERIGTLGLDPERPVAVVCGGGMRSVIGASILLGRGFKSVCDVAGGMNAWRQAGLPVESGK